MSFLSRDPREKKKTLHAHDKRGLPNARGSWEGSNIGSWEEVEWVARAGQGRVFARIRWSRLLLGSVKVKRYSSKQSKIKNHNSKLIICCGFSSSVTQLPALQWEIRQGSWNWWRNDEAWLQFKSRSLHCCSSSPRARCRCHILQRMWVSCRLHPSITFSSCQYFNRFPGKITHYIFL